MGRRGLQVVQANTLTKRNMNNPPSPLINYKFCAPVLEAISQKFTDAVHAVQKPIVFTNGCFDLLHAGHIHLLNLSGVFGHLIVGLNSDASVKALKGPGRPYQAFWDRGLALASIRSVQAVVGFDGARCDRLIRQLSPQIYVKGGDYSLETLDKDELKELRACGAEIIFYPTLPGRSTSELVKIVASTKPEKAGVIDV